MHANMLQFDDVSMHAETSGAYNKQQYAKVWTISGPSISNNDLQRYATINHLPKSYNPRWYL